MYKKEINVTINKYCTTANMTRIYMKRIANDVLRKANDHVDPRPHVQCI